MNLESVNVSIESDIFNTSGAASVAVGKRGDEVGMLIELSGVAKKFFFHVTSICYF